jgi:UPF0271 protein
MTKKVFVLDSSGIIGGFVSGEFPNYTTSQVVTEIKDIKSQLFLQEALENRQMTIKEPSPKDIGVVEEVIIRSGDLLRLSDVDKEVVALAVSLKRDNMSPTVVTDDYSIQNVLKIMEIPFRSVLTRGIDDVVGWIKFCKGCKKTYPSDYQGTDCEICGSPISRKRTRKLPEKK